MTSYCVARSASSSRAIPNAKLCMGCPDIPRWFRVGSSSRAGTLIKGEAS